MGVWQDPAAPGRPLPRRLLLALAGIGLVVAVAFLTVGTDQPVTGEDAQLEVTQDPAVAPQQPGGWQRLAPSPLAPRSGHAAVWTGTELVVWGGAGADGPLGDGAAYDPAADRWRRLPPAPEPPFGPAAAGTWTGSELVVLGATSALAYDPETDRWRVGAPVPAGSWVPASATWDGREVVVVDGAGRRAVGYEPGADRWRDLPTPEQRGLQVQAAVELLGTVVLLGVHDTGSVLITYDPGTERWGPVLPVPGAGAALPGRAPVLAADPIRERVVVAARNGAVSAWSSDGGWAALPSRDGAPAQVLPTARGLLAWSGRARSAVLGPSPSGRWRLLGTAPLRARTGERAVWTGGELLVWGGRAVAGGEPLRDGAALRLDAPSPTPHAEPAEVDGSWRRLPPGPVDATPGRWALAWTGSTVAALDTASLTKAVGFDPAAATWWAGPRAPRPVRRVAHETVWTGREFVVVATHAGRAMRPLSAVAYDPGAGTWRVLASPPVGVSGQVAAAWTGERVLVVAGDEAPATLAYDPRADAWEELASPRRPGRPRVLGWAGGRLVALSATGTVHELDPAADTWRAAPDVPAGIRADLAVTAGDQLVVHDRGTGRTAVYDTAARRWDDLGSGTGRAVATGWRPYPLVASTEQGLVAFHAGDRRWRRLPPPPSPGRPAAAAWTGERLLVWTDRGEGLAFEP